MKYCFVKQDGIKDCGVACLLMIIRFYRGNASKEYLRELTHTTKNGTSAYDLMKAGEKFNFTTFGLRGKVEDLEEDYFPVIAHVACEGYHHFVVIYQYNRIKKQLVIADPAVGIKKVSLEDFLKISTSQFVVFIQDSTILEIHSKHPIFKILIDFFKNNRKSLTFILMGSFFYTILSVICSFSCQTFIHYMNTTPYFYFVSMFLFFIILKCFFQWFRFSILIRVTGNFDTCLFENLYHRLFLLPDSYYENRTTGELLARITDLANLKNMMNKFILEVVMDSLLAILSLIVLFFISPLLTMISLVFVFLDILVFLLFKNKMRNLIGTFKESNAKFQSYLVDTISSVSSIRHIEGYGYIEKKFQNTHDSQLQDSMNYQRCWNFQTFLKNLIHGISNIAVIVFGCYLISIGQLSTISFMSYLFLLSFFLNPIESIFDLCLDYQEGKEAYERMEEFYQVEEERTEDDVKREQLSNLKLSHIFYSYRRNEEVLVDASHSFSNGEKVLIYGKSGSGKSTLIKILAGYIHRYQGDILINGKSIEKNFSILRNYVTYVAQNETLLNMSIRDNITMGREIAEEKFIHICKLLHIDEFISKYVLTYDMMIEENGINLSGGEKQRIILARSILRESDVYVLDESLCNMDVALEREVLQNLFSYLEDKLVIVVSHRFYNEDLYDRKICMEKGEKYAENYS